MDSKRVTQITKQTLMPLGMVIGIVTTCLFLQHWLNEKFLQQRNHIDVKFEEQSARMGGVEKRLYALEQAATNHWNYLDMREWVLDLRAANPEISVPQVTEVDNGNNN